MLALPTPTPLNPPKKTTPNLLPCSIAYSGPLAIDKRHWDPQQSSTSTNTTTTTTDAATSTSSRETEPLTSHLRGRLLHGLHLPLPAGYEGRVLTKQIRQRAPPNPPQPRPYNHTHTHNHNADGELDDAADEADEADDDVPTHDMVTLAGFDSVVVWGHESVAGGEDGVVRGLGEWVGWAAAAHGFERGEPEGLS